MPRCVHFWQHRSGYMGRKAGSFSGTGPGIRNAALVLVMSHTITQDILKAVEDHVLWLSAFLVVIAALWFFPPRPSFLEPDFVHFPGLVIRPPSG